MRLDDCFQLGRVIKPHGLKGEVSVFIESDNPEYYSEMESVFVLMQNKLVPFFIEALDVRDDRAIVKFEGIDTHDEALSLKDHLLYLPLDVLPPLEGTSFYFHEIIGFGVLDKQHGIIGTVQAVYDSGAQNLLSVLADGGELLIPIHDDIILNIDREQTLIEVDLPDGLIELYKPDDNAD